MKQNKKGFTLIELLAVIVILAIIALIAVPVIMNIISNARKSAAADTAYSVLNAAELYYAEQLLENPNEAFAATTFTFTTTGDVTTVSPELELKGTMPTSGSVTLTSDGKASISAALEINGFSCSGVETITCS
ncbi:MAG: prepilin-type N-terminal cleavage/methylation domain-containing protein [Firmicutes bacterium]|nr:prepilin-type N-terminal cleavage/methylation domain-containing protein [Bacillota bacterium]